MELSDIEVKLSRATTLPILPHAVSQVLSLTENASAGAKEYERVISQDTALAAKILRTANSSYFGGNGTIKTLERAFMVIGTNTIRSICLTVAFHSAVTARKMHKQFNIRSFWQHSLAVACTAKVLAYAKRFPQVEEAFISGLIHDLGKLALAMFALQEASEVYDYMQTNQCCQYDAELAILGFTHQEIGKLAAVKWSLPAAYQTTIAHHHTPSAAKEMDALTAFVHAGNILAHEIEVVDQPESVHPVMDEHVAQYLSMSNEQYESIKIVIAKEIARLSEYMGV